MLHLLREFSIHDFLTFRRQQERHGGSGDFPFGKPYPCLGERFSESGSAKGHYFHQDLLVARRIFLNNPQIHFDVGSRIDGFVAHVASFRKIFVFDIRPLTSNITNVDFLQGDLMAKVPERFKNYCDSLSCLHAVEHFGLGRYGDPIRSNGYLVGLDNLYQLLKSNGKFYFSVPIGPQRIEFNAHRVFSLKYLLEIIKGKFRIELFSYVDDNGDLHENVALADDFIDNNCGCIYGCGIFEMTKV